MANRRPIPRVLNIYDLVARWRFRALLALLLCVMLLQPLMSPFPLGDSVSIVLIAVLYSATYFGVHGGVGAGSGKRGPAVAVFVIWACLSIAARQLPGSGVEFAAAAAAAAITVLLGWVTFAALFRERRADLDSLAGSIFGFFLLALLFGQVFRGLEFASPGSFALSGDAATPGELVYFSLVTITTLGYGDVLPISPMARILSGIEAALGTLYIAILIGRIVGAIGPKPPAERTGEAEGPRD